MNLTALADHTIDVSLLGHAPTVLDVGCRGFVFGDSVRRLRPFANIIEVDIDDLSYSGRPYIRAAIHHSTGTVGVSNHEDLQSRHVIPGTSVQAYTLAEFTHSSGVNCWDIIKLDCEGSEYDILSSITYPIANQITVEFHQHTPQGRRDYDQISNLISRLSKWYIVAQHELTECYSLGLNYWDTLLISKDARNLS